MVILMGIYIIGRSWWSEEGRPENVGRSENKRLQSGVLKGNGKKFLQW
jgi:hypothetical protein